MKSTGAESVKNNAWRHLSLRSSEPHLQICHSKHNIPHVPRPYMYKKYLCFTLLNITHLIFLRVCVLLRTLGGNELTQSLFSSTSDASPPSSLPGIPESILAIENVKNEEKAEEGTTSAAAGRVLSHCTDIPQSPEVVVAQNRRDLTWLS